MTRWDLVSAEFEDACARADRSPTAPQRLRAREDELALALAHGDAAEEYVARCDLADALAESGDAPRLLEQVGWLRAALEDGDALDRGERLDVLGRVAAALDEVEACPEVPLEAWESLVEDLDHLVRAQDCDPGVVHGARARLAAARGDDVGVDESLARWLLADPQAQVECPACAERERALVLARRDPQAALDLLGPVVSGALACADEPRFSLAVDADLRSRLGDLDGAVGSFRGCWLAIADDPLAARSVARCLRVLVRIGNTDRAVDLLLPRLGWRGGLRTAADRMWFAGTAAWVLRHGRRLGLVPDEVDGRPAADLVDELAGLATGLAGAFDARGGSRAAREDLADAHDDTLVAADPTLPPVRLPGVAADPGPSAPRPRTAAEVLALAARVRQARRSLEPGVETALRGWEAARADVRPLLTTPAEHTAAGSLDRAGAYLLRDLGAERSRLEEAAAATERGDDAEEAAHVRADLAVLAVRTALTTHRRASSQVTAAREAATALAEDAEARGWPETAAAVRRWYAVTTRPSDAPEHLRHAADLYGAAGLAARRALCLLDAAPLVPARGARAVAALVEEAESVAGDHPVVRAQALDVRARMARAAGDTEAAVALHESAVAAAGSADGTRVQALFSYCDLLVERQDWARLEARAADALATAARVRDPVALAVAQRHLGLAWLETGRPVEAAELLEAALPVVRRHVPALAGPAGWALGNAVLGLGAHATARRAFAVAASAFTATGRPREASHAHLRAGLAAAEYGEATEAAEHLDAAVRAARAGAAVDVLLGALCARAGVRASTGDLDAGLADLDAALAETARFAAGLPDAPEEDHDDAFDPEVHEPDVLRQGAHLLAAAGRTDEAVERLLRAESLVGGGHEVVLQAERGAVLADAGRLEEAEPLLRAVLPRLRAAGRLPERVAAAEALTRALDAADRPHEALEVWEAHGV
ncbi:hypothetical protein [Phycicoccus flavus]|uniref:Tetratricopeptide repeat protein n=1 Tax=Phycicoccus flavus TaxID=2502783 RepID=A0A8T6R492_9MICO|nr:hypothetical protein [Phycicoccus flavus]NHA68423.1 hypothetical protein [Phycicoccus flavus]